MDELDSGSPPRDGGVITGAGGVERMRSADDCTTAFNLEGATYGPVETLAAVWAEPNRVCFQG